MADEEPSGGGKSPGKGGSGSTAGGKTDTGGEGGGSTAVMEGIDVQITAPTAAVNPNADAVLVDNEVTVLCSIKAESTDAAVDGSSVTVEVLDATGEVAVGQDDRPLSATGAPTGEVDEYSASFVLTSVATGRVSFRCSASSVDKASGGKHEVATFIDHGPTITARLPEVDSAYALKGVMPVEFTVTPARLTDDDDGADVTGVTLSVGGAVIDAPLLVQDDDDPTIYRAEIDFTDPVLFKEPPPEHTSVHIEATNSREPKAATAVNDYGIVVDGKGPDIAYVLPIENATVHGETVVEFTAEDSGAGLDLDTLELSLTGVATPYKYDASKPTIWTKTGNRFKFRFDSLSPQLAGVAYQINVSIRAQDRAGNATDGKVLVLNKDDYGPVIDLDPGNARAINSQNVCSLSFDPLGAAANDQASFSVSSIMLRALVYDRTNTGSGGNVFYMSKTNQNSVRLYIQPDSSKPILKDTNQDGICDDLARTDFAYISLAALNRGGNLRYGPDGTTAPAVADVCTVQATDSGEQAPMCNGTSDMRAVVQHDVGTGGDEPVVYAFAPAAAGFECTGKKFDLSSDTSDPVGGDTVSLSADGWICLVAKASDTLRNTGVSRPLRVCLDDPAVTWPGDGVPDCMKGAPPPSCLDNCTAPPTMPAHIYRN